jgi:hypothetical protein
MVFTPIIPALWRLRQPGPTECSIVFKKANTSQAPVALPAIPVVLATQKAEIRRIVVRSQPGNDSSREPISKKTLHKKKGWWSGSR